MKKRIITALIAATIVVLPTAAYAATLVGDFDEDGVVSYEDYNELNYAVKHKTNSKSDYDLNGDGEINELDLAEVERLIVPTHIVGDLNDDGIVALEDWNLIYEMSRHVKPVFGEEGQPPLSDANGGALLNYDGQADVSFDLENADLNKDGYVNIYDFNIMTDAMKATDLKGDVNNDGFVNNKDIALLKKYLSGLSGRINIANSDLNNDDKVNLSDYLLLRRMINEQA